MELVPAKASREWSSEAGKRGIPVYRNEVCAGVLLQDFHFCQPFKKDAGLNTSAPRGRNISTWCEAPGYNTPIPQVLKGRNISIPHSAVTMSSISPFQGLLVFFYHSGRCPELCYNSLSGNHLFNLISSLVTVCPGMLGDLCKRDIYNVRGN